MSNYRRFRQNKNTGKIKNSHNLGSIISDKDALKIHGLNFQNYGYSSDSDSGKSDFDEEYYKYKPQPLPINRKKVVTIKRLNTRNEQTPIKKSILLSDVVKKGFSNLESGKRETRSTSPKRISFENVTTDQPKHTNIETINPRIQPNLNEISVKKKLFPNIKDGACQPSRANNLTGHLESKNLLQKQKILSEDWKIKPMQIPNSAETLPESKISASLKPNNHGVYKNLIASGDTTSRNNFSDIKVITYEQSSGKNLTPKRPLNIDKAYQSSQSAIPKKPAQEHEEVSNDRSIRSIQMPHTAQTIAENGIRIRASNDHKNLLHKVSADSGKTTRSRTNLAPTHKPVTSSAPQTLNVSNLPDALPKLTNSSTRSPVAPHIVTNTFRTQNGNSPNRNFSWSPDRDIFAGESTNTVEENTVAEESACLYVESSRSFCGRCMDFILCRRC